MNFEGGVKSFPWHVIGLAFIVGVFLLIFFSHRAEISSIQATPVLGVRGQKAMPDQRVPLVQIGAVKIPVELATTSASQQKGLSGRKSLDADKGMLFVFARPDRYRFWMPDMHFALDMIWIQDGKVADIDENVSNDFNPAAPKFYSPSSPVRYVLEVNAGFSLRHGIHVGDAVIFNNLK